MDQSQHLGKPGGRGNDKVIANAYPKGSQLHEHFDWANAGLMDAGSNYFKARASRRPRYKNLGQLLRHTQYLRARELGDPALPPELIGVPTWDEVLNRLKKAHKGNHVEVAVYPAGGIQHAMATHDIPPDA